MDVYVDVLFLLNLILNYLILLASGRLAGAPLRRGRIIGAAALAAGGSCGLFFLPMPLWAGLLCKAALSGVTAVTAFGRRRFGRSLLSFYLVSFLFGGGVWALSLVFRSEIRRVNGVAYAELTPEALLLFAAAVYLLTARAAGGFADLSGERPAPRRVVCTKGADSVTFSALPDSGLSLRDPVSNAPVIVTEARVLAPLFSPGAAAVLTGGGDGGAERLCRLPPGERGIFRLIPCRTATGSALLPAFRPDALTVDGKPFDGVVALCPERLEGAEGLMACDGNGKGGCKL